MKNATTMISPQEIFSEAPVMSSFAVKDIAATRRFYGDTLGLDVRDGRMGGSLEIHGKAGPPIWIYEKSDHQPAVFTVLNLQVRDVDEAVDALSGAGIKLEHYDGEQGIKTDAKGIARGSSGVNEGPSIAWFKDPSGNIVSVLER